jgi:hypothetical protein
MLSRREGCTSLSTKRRTVAIWPRPWGPRCIATYIPNMCTWQSPLPDSRKEEKRGIKARIPTLNIVVMVIGSRGDIQPFLKIGKILNENYGHRVRIATHPTFKTFVEEDIGLEFLLRRWRSLRAHGLYGQEPRTHSEDGDGQSR